MGGYPEILKSHLLQKTFFSKTLVCHGRPPSAASYLLLLKIDRYREQSSNLRPFVLRRFRLSPAHNETFRELLQPIEVQQIVIVMKKAGLPIISTLDNG